MKDYSKINNNIFLSEDENRVNFLKDFNIPPISLLNQDGNLLKLNRTDTFRIVLFCFSMTGRPDKPLPKDWNSIKGATGCTSQICSIRDNYDEIISLNSVPVGVSTQSVDDLKEMSVRLFIPYDVLSDFNLELQNLFKLPIFSIDKKIYLKRLTLIIEKSVIKKVFYPIFFPDKHINEVIQWLKKN